MPVTYYPDCKVLVSIFFYAWVKKKEAAPSSGLWTILFQTVLTAPKTSSREQSLNLHFYQHSTTGNFKSTKLV